MNLYLYSIDQDLLENMGMETIEAKQENGNTSGSAGNIGQVLERIVQAPSKDSTERKKLIFPRESVNAADFQIPKPGASRGSNEPVASAPAVMPERAPKTDMVETSQPKVPHQNSSNIKPTNQSPLTQSPASQQKSTRSISASQSVAKSREKPIPSKAVAPVQTRASSSVPKQTKKKVIAKVLSKEQVRRKDPVKHVSPEKLVRTSPDKSGISIDTDLEAFMRDTERTEEREIRCNPQTMNLLQQIAERTGCDPSDIANQAVTGVAQAIQQAGFTFSLPMHAELKHRRKSR